MLREMIGLNGQQARFAEADIGIISLAGGPGSGKTMALVSRVLTLLLRAIRPDDIVLLTPHDHRVRPLQQHLTNMPRTFQERRHLLERQGWDVEPLRRAADLAAQVYVGTILQYAHGVLHEHDAGMSTVWTDTEAIAVIAALEVSLAREPGNTYEPGDGSKMRFFEWQGILKSRLAIGPRMNIPVEGWERLLRSYRNEQRSSLAGDRHDLLANAYRLATGPAGDRRNGAAWRNLHLLVDDFQNIPELAFWWFDALCRQQQSYSIAVDPGQPPAGNPPFSPHQVFTGTYPAGQHFRLTAPHRASRSIAMTVERIAVHGGEGAAAPYAGYVGGEEPFNGVMLHLVSGRPNLEAGLLYKLVHQTRILLGNYSSTAVVYPDDGKVGAVATLLSAMGVPYAVDPALSKPSRTVGAPGIPEPHTEARQIIGALRLQANPFDRTIFMEAASMGLGPGRASLTPDELAQITDFARPRGMDLVQAARHVVQTVDRRHRLYRILPPLLDMHAALQKAVGEVQGPDSLISVVAAARRIVSDGRGTPPTARDDSQLEKILALCQAYPRRREETTLHAVQRLLDRFSPVLHFRSSPLLEDGFDVMEDRVTITTSEGAVGGEWKHMIALTGGERLRGGDLFRHLFRAGAAAGRWLDIIVPALSTGGRDGDAEAAVRDVLGADVQAVEVTKRDIDDFYDELYHHEIDQGV